MITLIGRIFVVLNGLGTSNPTHYIILIDKFELGVFTPAPVILSEQRELKDLRSRLQFAVNWCEDSSIPLRFTRNDKPGRTEQLFDKLEFIK